MQKQQVPGVALSRVFSLNPRSFSKSSFRVPVSGAVEVLEMTHSCLALSLTRPRNDSTIAISISVAKSLPQLIIKKLRSAGAPVPGKGGEGPLDISNTRNAFPRGHDNN